MAAWFFALQVSAAREILSGPHLLTHSPSSANTTLCSSWPRVASHTGGVHRQRPRGQTGRIQETVKQTSDSDSSMNKWWNNFMLECDLGNQSFLALLMRVPYSRRAWTACRWSGWLDGVWCNFPSCWGDSDTEIWEDLGLLPTSPSCQPRSGSESAEGEVLAGRGTEAQRGRTPAKNTGTSM